MRGSPFMLRCAMDLCYPIQSYRGWVSNCPINVGEVDHECSKVGFRILFTCQIQMSVSTTISLTLAFICSDAWQFTSWQQECMSRCFPCTEVNKGCWLSQIFWPWLRARWHSVPFDKRSSIPSYLASHNSTVSNSLKAVTHPS